MRCDQWWRLDEDARTRMEEAQARLDAQNAQCVQWLPGPYAMTDAQLRAEVAFGRKGPRWYAALAELNDRERGHTHGTE